MTWIRHLLCRLRGDATDGPAALRQALHPFLDPQASTLSLLRGLIARLRPDGHDDADVGARFVELLRLLENESALRHAFRSHLLRFLASRQLVTFFTDSGLLPPTGFFSEWWRILGNRLLPEEPDTRRLKDCLHLIFDRPDDWRWLSAIPGEQMQRLWALLAPSGETESIDWQDIERQLLDALLLLAHRISGLGLHESLMRAAPDFESHLPRFVALSAEALAFVEQFRRGEPGDGGEHLLVIANQCRDTLQRIRKRARSDGTSLSLSYVLTRCEQNLERLDELVAILAAWRQPQSSAAAVAAWSDFAHTAFVAENRRNSLDYYLGQLSRVLAVRVTENAARTGEHYICETPAEYRHMWASATGAGILIGIMALLKIHAGNLHAPLAIEALMYSLIYGLGFALIYLLGMTVATKQPAMTAQTLASMLGDLRPTRAADLERLVDVICAVSRSQLAAIAGNVLVALPMALAIGLNWPRLSDTPAIPPGKESLLLASLDPLSWAIPHAAIAGFFLYLSGLISGYFDNYARYAGIARRIAYLRWLRTLLGGERAQRFGNYIADHLGGLMGNLLFGCMLGSTGVIGTLLGLPLDIRHIAFSSANLGYALVGSDFSLAWSALALAIIGILAIGFTNLAVSFTLAMRTALRARDIRVEHWRPLLGALWQRLRRQPGSFFLPLRQGDR